MATPRSGFRFRFGLGVTIALAVAFGLGLSGCGQKGNLYLPTEPASAGRALLPGSVGNTASQSAQTVLRVLNPRSGASAPLTHDKDLLHSSPIPAKPLP